MKMNLLVYFEKIKERQTVVEEDYLPYMFIKGFLKLYIVLLEFNIKII